MEPSSCDVQTRGKITPVVGHFRKLRDVNAQVIGNSAELQRKEPFAPGEEVAAVETVAS
jgi:hypothetical protein